MGQVSKSGNFLHDQSCNVAEATRQAAVAGAAQSAAGQILVNAAEIAWARSCLLSCRQNNGGAGQEPYIQLLRSLGTGGI
jgi:hypothetical protein